MIENASGIVLRKRRLTETSLIIHWLSPQAGRLATVAKGALRPNSVFRGKLDLFYEADFSFTRSRRSDLHALREVAVRQFHPGLRRELACLEQASYAAELIECATETETPLTEVFDCFRGWLLALPARTPAPDPVLRFELQLLEILGLQPDPAEARLTAGTTAVIQAWGNDWEAANRVQLSAAQARELSAFLNRFLAFHIGKVPASRHAAVGF